MNALSKIVSTISLFIFFQDATAQQLKVEGLQKISDTVQQTDFDRIGELRGREFKLSVPSGDKDVTLIMKPEGVFDVEKIGANQFRVIFAAPEKLHVISSSGLNKYLSISAIASIDDRAETSISVGGNTSCVTKVRFKQKGAPQELDLSKFERKNLEWLISHPGSFDIVYEGPGLQVTQIKPIGSGIAKISLRIKDGEEVLETQQISIPTCSVSDVKPDPKISNDQPTINVENYEAPADSCLSFKIQSISVCKNCEQLRLNFKLVSYNSCSRQVRCDGIPVIRTYTGYDPETIYTAWHATNPGTSVSTSWTTMLSDPNFSLKVGNPASCYYSNK